MGLRAKFHPNCDTAHAKLKRSKTFSRQACRVFGCYGLGLKNSVKMKKNKQRKIEQLKKQIQFHKEMGNEGMAATLQFRIDKLQTALK